MDWATLWTNVSTICADLVLKVLGAVIVFLVGRALIRFVLSRLLTGEERHPLDDMTRNFLRNLAKIVLYVILIVAVVGILGIPLASVITVLATAGAAVALALQGSLANFAAGIVLIIFKPLKTGEFVEVSGNSGTVIDVGIFYTTLQTGDNRHVTIPNSTLISSVVINYSREEKRRIDLDFSAAMDTDIDLAKNVVLAVLNSYDKVLRDPAPFVRVTALNDSSVAITVRAWCEAADYWNVRFDLIEGIKEAFDLNGVQIPYPQLDVHIRNNVK